MPQIFLNLPNTPIKLISLDSNVTLQDFKHKLLSEHFVSSHDFYVSNAATTLKDNDCLFDSLDENVNACPQTLSVRYRLRGGKGGFGSNLKRQRAPKRLKGEAKNLGSCRDLSGRRLRIAADAQQ
jgi:hypothetical protein